MRDHINECAYQVAERLIAEAVASNATYLSLSHLRIEELPESIGQLASLTSLNLSVCHQLTTLAGIEGLKGLSSLNLSGCRQLNTLAGIEGLKGLT